VGLPERKRKLGRPPSRIRVLTGEPLPVERLRTRLNWQRIRVRAMERGDLCERFAVRRVWTVYQGIAIEDWLVVREESDGKYSYALCNASADTSLEQLAWWKCQRYFIERSNQDVKSELGWGELLAQKYSAWEHHLALTVLASWFVALAKYEWARDYPRDPELLHQLEMEVLPALSIANVREPFGRLRDLTAGGHAIEAFDTRTSHCPGYRAFIQSYPLAKESA